MEVNEGPSWLGIPQASLKTPPSRRWSNRLSQLRTRKDSSLLLSLCKMNAWRELQLHCQNYPEECRPRFIRVTSTIAETKLVQVYHKTALGIVCSTLNSRKLCRTDQCLDAVRTIIAACPEQVRCGQYLPGCTALRDASRNMFCSPELFELLLRADVASSSAEIPAIFQLDQDGLLPIDHIFHEIHHGSSADCLVKLRLLLEHTRHGYRSKSNFNGYSPMIRLLTTGSVSLSSTSHVKRRNLVHDAVQLLLLYQSSDLSSERSKLSGCTPLHLALREYELFPKIAYTLLHHDKRATVPMVCTRNDMGELPLHVACRKGVGIKMIKELLQATCHSKPDLSLQESCYLIDCCWRNYLQTFPISSTLWATEHEANQTQIGLYRKNRQQKLHSTLLDKSVDQTNSQKGGTFSGEGRWQSQNGRSFRLLERMMDLIVNAMYSDTIENGLILHKIARLSQLERPLLPPPLLVHFLQKHSEQITMKDSNGKLPVHHALEVSQSVSRKTQHEHSREDWWRDWIFLLCQKYPHGCLTSDNRGQIPLHFAVGSRDSPTVDEVNPVRDRVVRDLIEAHPQTAERLDPQSLLYPALLASANSTLSLDLVYDMLRQSPDVLGKGRR